MPLLLFFVDPGIIILMFPWNWKFSMHLIFLQEISQRLNFLHIENVGNVNKTDFWKSEKNKKVS